jgi:hypothetical protein
MPDQLAGRIWPRITRIARSEFGVSEDVVFVRHQRNAKPAVWSWLEECSEVVSASDSVRDKSCCENLTELPSIKAWNHLASCAGTIGTFDFNTPYLQLKS